MKYFRVLFSNSLTLRPTSQLRDHAIMTAKAKLNRERRLLLVIGISFSFFIAEIGGS